MFLQVRIRSRDWSAFRFIWRPPGSHEPPDDFQMDVQIFGAVSSPSICSYVLRQAAMDCGPDAPLVDRQVVDHFYVDNWLISFKSKSGFDRPAKRRFRASPMGFIQLNRPPITSRKSEQHARNGFGRPAGGKDFSTHPFTRFPPWPNLGPCSGSAPSSFRFLSFSSVSSGT